MKVKYDYQQFNPVKLDPQNIDRLAVERVPTRSFVMDVGCATGFMGDYLKKRKECQVMGLELREQEAVIAKKKLDKVFIADIEKKETVNEVLHGTRDKKFDVILATSLIEHLKDPNRALRTLKKLMKPSGVVIMTTPNIAHWSIRLSLLKGDFTYTEYGILDNTHLHFFTEKTFKELFEENGFLIQEFAIDPVGGGYPRISKILARYLPNVFAYQMLIVAKLYK